MLQRTQKAAFHFFNRRKSENIEKEEKFLSGEDEVVLQLISDLDREIKIIQDKKTRDGYFTQIAFLGLVGFIMSTTLYSMDTMKGITPETFDKRPFEILFGVLPSLGLLYFAGPKYWSACERNIQLSDLSFDFCARVDEFMTSNGERLAEMNNNVMNLKKYLNSALINFEKKATQKFL